MQRGNATGSGPLDVSRALSTHRLYRRSRTSTAPVCGVQRASRR